MIQGNRAHVKADKKGGKWLQILILAIGGYLVWILVKGVWEVKTAYRRIDDARQTLASEQAKNVVLKQKWEEVQTREYLENVARNGLNMQKEGETVVVLTGEISSGSATPEEASAKASGKQEPNYLKWWSLMK